MKVLLCDGIATIAHQVASISDNSDAAVVFKARPRSEYRMRFADVGPRFAFNISMTMVELLRQKEMHDFTGWDRALLLAYDMPILAPYGEEQPFISHDLYGQPNGDGLDADTWRMCEGIACAAYESVAFDYIFTFDEAPSVGMLARNGITTGAGNVVKVKSWHDVLAVLRER